MRIPQSAMVLAAGLGTRMRPITDRIPKPLVEVAGRTLLDRALDRVEEAGVKRAIVNVHYKGEQIERHLARRARPAITISHEDELLETGGGVAKALPLLGEVFFVANSDVMWLDGKLRALDRLAHAFDPDRHDAMLLFQRTASAIGYEGRGDFLLNPAGVPQRRPERGVAPYLFAGVQVLHSRLFAGAPSVRFSLNVLYDKALAAGRLGAIVHDGEWYHIGTPEGLAEAESRLAFGPGYW
jgi:MurNAc alpha-1-phosphate uridylyltransferase